MVEQQLQRSTVVRYGVLPRDKRKEILGIDCPELLEWRNWTPGTEYVKYLQLKNVSTSTLKVKYKQTASKSFSMDFPEPFKLRPGMSQALKVVFRPLKLQQYSDHIEIFVNDGSSFIILVEAYTPATHILVPPSLDFGFVPCKEVQTRQLSVRNTGDTRVGLSWKLEAPFAISPLTASLMPGELASFEVSFLPTEACSYTGNAACQVDDGTVVTTQITGIGKFPYLSVEQPTIDFGNVLVGKSVERTFRFGNHSIVQANFAVQHTDGADDGVFTVTPSKGTLGPDEYSLMRVTFTPKHTGTFSSETFTISTAGGNRVALNLRGYALGPTLTLSARSVNFGNVVADTAVSRVLYLQNHSDVPVTYDFQVDALDCFTFSKPRGVVKAQMTDHVTITFKSSAPANFWRRVTCLIKDADPQGIDLLATCYSDKSRPPPLTNRHVAAYMSRIAGGGAAVEYNPAASDSVPPSPVPSVHGSARPSSAQALEDGPEAAAAGAGALSGTAGAQALAGPDSWELFFDGQDPARAITIDSDTLDFGTCSRLSASEYKTVTVTNNTSAKVTAFFQVPLWLDPNDRTPKPVFAVLPESVDIKPQGQAMFRVAFRPPRDGQHYSSMLQLCAYVKSMRNFRLVTDAQVVPPWSHTIQACGNTFLHTNPEFSPKIEVSHTTVSFPPCRPGERVAQTLMMLNYGDTPVAFAFHTASLPHQMEIKPARGVVLPKQHFLVAMRFSPSSSSPCTARVPLVFNGVAVNAMDIHLRGAAHVPRLSFDVPGGSTLYFRPTCVGANSQRTMTVHNTSRVPVMFKWDIPSRLEGVVTVSPVSGLLRGYESTQVVWSFAPGKTKTYDAQAQCMLLAPSDSSALVLPQLALPMEPSSASGFAAPESLPLRLVGEGTQGAMAIDPPSLELGPLKVGHMVKRTVNLVNQSDGVLRYVLECMPQEGDEPIAEGATPVEFSAVSVAADQPRADGSELWVDDGEGAIAARASKQITVTFFPRYRKHYRLQLRCRTSTVAPLPPPAPLRPLSGGAPRLPPLAGPDGTADTAAAAASAAAAAAVAGPPVWQATAAVCTLSAQVTFPSVMVTDAFREGMAKQVLWDMLGLRSVNAELQRQVTPLELELDKMETRGALTTDSATAVLRPFVLDFGLCALGADTVAVQLHFSNTTPLPLRWEMHSYDAPELEMENWVEPGRPRNEEEKARDFITEHKIFEIRPRHGQLEAGDSAVVTVLYRPDFEGSHDWPVFFHISDGKRLRVQLQGCTVAPPVQRLLLTPARRTFTLAPTPIGETAAPVQVYLLRNGGPGSVGYTADLEPLARLAQENFGFEVLKLVSGASGAVAPEGVAPLCWRFTPLEAKVYSLDVPLLLGDGSMEIITLQGRGYHPDAPHLPAPLPEEGSHEWAAWPGFSGTPAIGPSAGGRLALVSHEVLSMGTVLPKGVARRVAVLTNACHYPVTFDWTLGVLADSAALQGCLLDITPAKGRLEPGERAVCRVSLEGGLWPVVFEGEAACEVAVDEEAVMAAATAMQEAAVAAAAPLDLTDTGSVIEEVIVQHPARGAYAAGSRLKSRLPTHAYMTAATVARAEKLATQWTRTLDSMTEREQEGASLPQLPRPQRITLTLAGRVLTAGQIKAGCYLPPHELEDARAALASAAAWVPPTARPFYEEAAALLPEALAAAAAAEASAAEGGDDVVMRDQGTGGSGTARSTGSAAAAAAGGAYQQQQQPAAADSEQLALLMETAARLSAADDLEGVTGHHHHSHHNGPHEHEASPLPSPHAEASDGQGSPMDITFAAGVGGSEGGGGPGGVIGLGTVLEAVAEGSEAHMHQQYTPGATPPELADGSDPNAMAGRDVASLLEAVSRAVSRAPSERGDEEEEGDPEGAGSAAPAAGSGAGSAKQSGGGAPAASSAAGALASVGGWKPLTLPPKAPEAPPPAAPTAAQRALAAAADVLQALLVEALDPARDPQVVSALEALAIEEVPAFDELSSGAAAAGAESSAAADSAADVAADGPSEDDEYWSVVERPEGYVSKAQASSKAGGAEAAGSEHPSPEGGDADGADPLAGVFRDPEFQLFAEYVLESAVMGLIEESAAGEWEHPGTIA